MGIPFLFRLIHCLKVWSSGFNYIVKNSDNQRYRCDMEIDRIIRLESLLEKKSFFLFGPRNLLA